MKTAVYRVLPFLFILLLSTGSVFLSCVTTPLSHSVGSDYTYVNTGETEDGRIFSTWVFSGIQSIVIVNIDDRSEKIELSSDEWEYNPETTEITIKKEISFTDYIVHAEGKGVTPDTFILNDIKPESDLLVILDSRLAIEGYDFTRDISGKKLIFRNDVDLKKTDWLIQYSTDTGGSSIGEWKPENQDQMSYIQAEHHKRVLDAWYDRQDTFWFLEYSEKSGNKPFPVKRKATAEELSAFKSLPVSVIKYRTGTPYKDLNLELGFNTSFPDTVFIEDLSEKFVLSGKMIEEYAEDGELKRKLLVFYDNKTSTDNITVELQLNGSNSYAEREKPEWLIEEKRINMGLPVSCSTQWSMLTTELDEMPKVVKTTAWTWSDDSIIYSVTADSSREDLYRLFIMEIIASRQKQYN